MRLIDADWIHQNSDERFPEEKPYQEAWGLTMVDSAPTIDAVPVVRCRECKHGKRGVDNVVICSHPCGKVISMTAGDFCSYGQRKETANE